jgi:hypothetical protein
MRELKVGYEFATVELLSGVVDLIYCTANKAWWPWNLAPAECFVDVPEVPTSETGVTDAGQPTLGDEVVKQPCAIIEVHASVRMAASKGAKK